MAGDAMKPFNREKFLLYMLAGIFIWQAAIFTGATIGCFRMGGKNACPDIGDRYDNTVGVMVATTLALLGAGAVVSANQKKSASSDDRDEPLVLESPEDPKQPESQVPAPVQPPAPAPAPVVVPGRRASQKNPQKNP